MKNRRLISTILIVTCTISAMAQQLKKDTLAATQTVKPLFFNAGLQYISNLTYAGRRDETSVPLLLPTFTIVSKQGFFISAIGYFDVGGQSNGDGGLSVTPGYVFAFDKARYFGGSVSATKYFISDASPIILSSFNATLDGQLYFNPGNIAKLTLGASYRFGKNNKNDIVNSAELSKDITVLKTGKAQTGGLKVTPTLTLYAGTQRFSETYYTNSVVQRSVDNPTSPTPINILFPQQPKQTIINETVTEEHQREVASYNLLALSGSLPVAYTFGKVQLNFTPYFIKPVKQVNYVNNTQQNGVYFLFTTGLSVTF